MANARSSYSFLERYGEILTKSGVASIPNALFYYQAELGLSVEAVWLVSVLLSHRWTSDLPYPSLGKISRCSGLSLATLRRYRRALEETTWQGKPLLQVVVRQRANGGQSSNGYDLSTLLEALTALVSRDRQVWFRNGPLVGDPLAETEDALAVDDPVDNSVENPLPPLSGKRGVPAKVERGASLKTERGVPSKNGRAGSRSSERGSRSKLIAHEEETVEPETSDWQIEDDAEEVEETPRKAKPASRAANSKAGASTGRDAVDLDSAHGEPPASSWLDQVIADYTVELHDDPANVRRNQTQTRRIWAESLFPESRFVERCARAKRKAAAAKVRKESTDGSGQANRMPYFFKVLRDLTGLD